MMAFNFVDYTHSPYVNPYGNLVSNALKDYQQAVLSKYSPELYKSQIQAREAASAKNMMISQLLQNMLGGGGGMALGGGGEGGGMPGNNLQAAALKAFTGIDPYLMSPQQEQDLKISGAIQQAAQKKNIETGGSDISREYLQDKVSMPEEYMGAFGSIKMLRDRALAEKGDEEARERLIQAATAERLVPEYSGFQLMSQGQRATVPALAHQAEAIRQGWPHVSHFVTNNLTPELQKEVERRHNEIVKGVNRGREQFFKSGGQERPEVSENIPNPVGGGTLMVDSRGKEKFVPDNMVEYYKKKGAKVKNLGE